ncbi:VWA domain-containing protein, partial [Streptomyces sp. NPDC051133]|uniref:VWA domain-containing protein n=1 Tax=Streptomyces sp. NPDC051133 TaxID=3155521 RepID=UPI0034374FB8
APEVRLAKDTAGAGTVLATSPLYMVSDAATGARLRAAGGSWLALAKLMDARKLRLVVRDPGGSGDGLVGTGAAAEAVWRDKGMDASALWLYRAHRRTRTVAASSELLRTKTGEVGLVPEYTLAASPASGRSALPGGDFAATLRYTWLPTATGIADARSLAALKRLQAALSGSEASEARAMAHLRDADGTATPNAGLLATRLAKALPVLAAHHVDHVFATWYPQDRRTDALIVIDVSGSMAEAAPGSTTSLIGLVREGLQSLCGVLPNDARLGLWEFGVRLQGANDYRELLPEATLSHGQRQALAMALKNMHARPTGTGLHDTILAAYTNARDHYRPGVQNQVMIFTDGRNQDDPGGASASQLSSRLQALQDPKRPVHLSVVAFGDRKAAEVVGKAIEPVGGYVDFLNTPDQVAAVFIHLAAGGLHH